MYFTQRQHDVLNFIRGFIIDHQVSPTLEEIAEHFSISRVTSHEHIKALEKKGALRKVPNQARSIELADDPRHPAASGSSLPIKGTIAAGFPILAVQDDERLDLTEWLPSEASNYILTVRGDSMIEDGIFDGDMVVVEQRQTARDGEVVVALVDGREATLKRLYREGDRVRLQPSNRNMDPLYPDDLQIQGVVVGLLRRYSARGAL